METTCGGSGMSREAMQMALEALDSDNPDIQLRAAIALREKLAQPEHDYRTRYDRGCYKCGSHYCPADCPDPTHLVPQQPLCTSPPKTEQEPVAWTSSLDFDDDDQEIIPAKDKGKLGTGNCDIALYTVPKQWVGLTDEDMESLFLNEDGVRFARYIEAKLREKNQ